MIATDLTRGDLAFMLYGAGTTAGITLLAVAAGTLLGVLFGIVHSVLPKWPAVALDAILDVFRCVPLLIQLILINAAQVVVGTRYSGFTVGVVVLSLYTSAYCSQIVDSGIRAVPAGLRRAFRSLGGTWRQDMQFVAFPISVRVMLPTWLGLSLGLLKDSALVSWLGVIELLKASQIVITRIQEPFFVLSITGLIYFIVSFPLARIGRFLEKGWLQND